MSNVTNVKISNNKLSFTITPVYLHDEKCLVCQVGKAVLDEAGNYPISWESLRVSSKNGNMFVEVAYAEQEVGENLEVPEHECLD